MPRDEISQDDRLLCHCWSEDGGLERLDTRTAGVSRRSQVQKDNIWTAGEVADGGEGG